HLRTVVDGQPIHLVHVRSPHPDALPLLLCHGWPGSFDEFLEVVDPLTRPDDPADAFHLVIPSLPGFGFSGPTRRPGWNHEQIAQAFAGIMGALGYERYGLQGGDLGSWVCSTIAATHPERVVGLHLNLVNLARPALES